MNKNKGKATRESTAIVARPMTHHEVIQIQRPNNYVPALHEEQRRELPAYAPRHEVTHNINLPLSATQHIEMRTSAVDRAKGFLIGTVPLYGAFAFGVTVAAVWLTGEPLLSFWAFMVFWLSFVLAWIWGYRETLVRSAEGIAHYEAKRKWDVVAEEQRRRWEHYDRQMGDGE
jgi:hypothetical protein